MGFGKTTAIFEEGTERTADGPTSLHLCSPHLPPPPNTSLCAAGLRGWTASSTFGKTRREDEGSTAGGGVIFRARLHGAKNGIIKAGKSARYRSRLVPFRPTLPSTLKAHLVCNLNNPFPLLREEVLHMSSLDLLVWTRAPFRLSVPVVALVFDTGCGRTSTHADENHVDPI